jgi:hypothetical protein
MNQPLDDRTAAAACEYITEMIGNFIAGGFFPVLLIGINYANEEDACLRVLGPSPEVIQTLARPENRENILAAIGAYLRHYETHEPRADVIEKLILPPRAHKPEGTQLN